MVKSVQPAATPLEDKLWQLLEPVVRSEGLMLVDVNWRRENRGFTLRLVVDRRDGGVTLDECATLSRQVSDLLDVEDPVPDAYYLEVSSPGLTRRLRLAREYDIFAGRAVRLTVRGDGGKTDVVDGRLLGRQGDDVLVNVDGRTRAVPMDRVAKARLELES